MFNANKKSITVNLKDPRGLDLVKNLLRKADICIENMAPGTIERLGLGYDDVKAINPGIIYAQVKGFGTGSPWEKSLAFDMIAQAAGGTISVTGEKGRRPVKPGISLGDTGTGMTMAISILAALRKRDKTGQGFRLQVRKLLDRHIQQFLKGALEIEAAQIHDPAAGDDPIEAHGQKGAEADAFPIPITFPTATRPS